MPTEIDRHSVQRLMMQDGQLVEVLPEKEFAEEHLPGALNIPLRAYPNNPEALNAMRAQAKCRKAR